MAARSGFWSRHRFDPSLWDERDWREHWADQRGQPLTGLPLSPPPAHSVGGFSLFPEQEKARQAEERSEQIDFFLRAMKKVRPRRG
jgi:hypothetical protein